MMLEVCINYVDEDRVYKLKYAYVWSVSVVNICLDRVRIEAYIHIYLIECAC